MFRSPKYSRIAVAGIICLLYLIQCETGGVADPQAQSSSEPSQQQVETTAPEDSLADQSSEPATIMIATLPPIADIYMDDQYVGKSNVGKLNVMSGTHRMTFVKGDIRVEIEMTFLPGENLSQLIRLNE